MIYGKAAESTAVDDIRQRPVAALVIILFFPPFLPNFPHFSEKLRFQCQNYCRVKNRFAQANKGARKVGKSWFKPQKSFRRLQRGQASTYFQAWLVFATFTVVAAGLQVNLPLPLTLPYWLSATGWVLSGPPPAK